MTDIATISTTTDEPMLASVITDARTRLRPVPVAALRGWRLLDVVWRGASHPARWFVAVADDGRVVVLSGHPERWAQIDGTRVGSADEALELATARADATRDMAKGWRLLTSADDLRLRPATGADARQRVDEAKEQVRALVEPPRVSGEGPWQVRLWSVTDGDLVLHEVAVAPDGAVTERTGVELAGLPVPIAR